ncbi:MAG: DUF4421 domain-containing protein [Bacteroidetes bacterium]|nr:MAG: DUF4421 domain-containing protein [Bacteroidota bacterium]
MNKYVLQLLFIIAFLNAMAQYDSNYVKTYYNDLCITSFEEIESYELNIYDKENTSSSLTYSSNAPISYGLGLDYKWLTLTYSNAFAQFRKGQVDDNYTTVRSLGVGITSQRCWFRAFYQRLKELNYDEVDEENGDIIYGRRNDINGNVLLTSFNYVFNYKKYSHNATLWQLDQQLKSAGTFTMGLATAIYTTSADSSLIPSSLKSAFTAQADIRNAITQNFVLTGGYLHTFVIKKCGFIHFSFIPGFCLQKTNADLGSGKQTSSGFRPEFYAESRIAIGYNGKKFYGGINSVSYFFTNNSLDAVLEHDYNVLRLFLGMRVPCKLKLPFSRQ